MKMCTTSSIVRQIRLNSILEPDVLMDFEFSKIYRQKAQLQPEERLMFAVLTDAIECFQKYLDAKSRKQLALSNSAEAWILSNNHSPFSFENICETLNINPVYLRLGVLRWRDDRQAKLAVEKRPRVRAISGRIKTQEIRV